MQLKDNLRQHLENANTSGAQLKRVKIANKLKTAKIAQEKLNDINRSKESLDDDTNKQPLQAPDSMAELLATNKEVYQTPNVIMNKKQKHKTQVHTAQRSKETKKMKLVISQDEIAQDQSLRGGAGIYENNFIDLPSQMNDTNMEIAPLEMTEEPIVIRQQRRFVEPSESDISPNKLFTDPEDKNN